jgi:hypothetical protein
MIDPPGTARAGSRDFYHSRKQREPAICSSPKRMVASFNLRRLAMHDVRMLTEEEITAVAGGKGDHSGTGPGTQNGGGDQKGQGDGLGWLREILSHTIFG